MHLAFVCGVTLSGHGGVPHFSNKLIGRIMNWTVFSEASVIIQLHCITAFSALVIGVIMLRRPKGTTSHKAIGRIFIGLMLATALSSIFIRELNPGGFSFIHLFVPLTLFASWEAIYYIRRKNLKRHKRAVVGMFFGALLIPGLLSFAPGRLMNLMFFH